MRPNSTQSSHPVEKIERDQFSMYNRYISLFLIMSLLDKDEEEEFVDYMMTLVNLALVVYFFTL